MQKKLLNFDPPQYQYVCSVPAREELIRPLNNFVNQTLYCSQTIVETETDTVMYIGEITSQPPSIAARSIMHMKVNCSLMNVIRRTTCLFYMSFWRTAADLWDSKLSMLLKVLEIIKTHLHFDFPEFLNNGGLARTFLGHTRTRRLTSATLLSRPLRATHLSRPLQATHLSRPLWATHLSRPLRATHLSCPLRAGLRTGPREASHREQAFTTITK